MRLDIVRRTLLVAVALLLPWVGTHATEVLNIGASRGTIDFAIGDSRVFRTTGSFKDWQGRMQVDDVNVPSSSVEVIVRTKSIDMLDRQQSEMLKDPDFFDVNQFPEMIFRSRKVERTGQNTLRVEGDVTLRGITRPMTLAVSVTDRKPDAAPGRPYARFRAEGRINRSEFGMTKFVDVIGDAVDITIRCDAWR